MTLRAVDPDYLSTDKDLEDMMDGVRLIRSLASTPALWRTAFPACGSSMRRRSRA